MAQENVVDPELKFGIFIPPIHAPELDPTMMLERDLRSCVLVDELGFDEVWVGEHHSSGWGYITSPEVFIANALPRTQRIHFGTAVLSIAYHSPYMAAERAMLLDHLSRGRVSLGLGPGASPLDAFQLGVDAMDTRRRLDEAVNAVQRLLRGESVTMETDWFTLREAHLQLTAYTRPSMELAVSSTVSPNGAKLAGKYGVSLVSFNASGPGSEQALAGRWNIVEEEARVHGQTVNRRGWRLVGGAMVLSDSEEESIKAVRHGLGRYMDFISNVAGLLPQSTAGAGPGLSKYVPDTMAQFDSDATARRMIEDGSAVIGTPDQAVERIQEMIKHTGGFGSMLISNNDWTTPDFARRSYELFATEVIPRIRGSLKSLKESEAWTMDHQAQAAAEATRARDQAIHDYAVERKERGENN
jgi:limonene 1,2-monooxygenase